MCAFVEAEQWKWSLERTRSQGENNVHCYWHVKRYDIESFTFQDIWCFEALMLTLFLPPPRPRCVCVCEWMCAHFNIIESLYSLLLFPSRCLPMHYPHSIRALFSTSLCRFILLRNSSLLFFLHVIFSSDFWTSEQLHYYKFISCTGFSHVIQAAPLVFCLYFRIMLIKVHNKKCWQTRFSEAKQLSNIVPNGMCANHEFRNRMQTMNMVGFMRWEGD